MGLQRVGHDWVTELNWTTSFQASFWPLGLPRWTRQCPFLVTLCSCPIPSPCSCSCWVPVIMLLCSVLLSAPSLQPFPAFWKHWPMEEKPSGLKKNTGLKTTVGLRQLFIIKKNRLLQGIESPGLQFSLDHLWQIIALWTSISLSLKWESFLNFLAKIKYKMRETEQEF